MEMKEVHRKLDKILSILEGNGNPQNGLIVKHELLANSVADCQARHTNRRGDVRFWMMAIIAISAVLVAALN